MEREGGIGGGVTAAVTSMPETNLLEDKGAVLGVFSVGYGDCTISSYWLLRSG